MTEVIEDIAFEGIMDRDLDAIRSILGVYFDALYRGDADALNRIFHPLSRLYVTVEGRLTETALPAYLDIVRNRPSPESLSSTRLDEIVSISIAGPELAVAVVRLILFDKHFTDQLSFMKEGGMWSIVSKMYHLRGVGPGMR